MASLVSPYFTRHPESKGDIGGHIAGGADHVRLTSTRCFFLCDDFSFYTLRLDFFFFFPKESPVEECIWN